MVDTNRSDNDGFEFCRDGISMLVLFSELILWHEGNFKNRKGFLLAQLLARHFDISCGL